MYIRPRPLILAPLAAVLVAAAAACGQTAVDPPAATPKPDERSIESAVPLSASERAIVKDFSEQSRELQAEWNKLREEFDSWRAGLIDCHPSSIQDALRGFAVDFKAVTEQARNLPRAPITTDLADSLISAAEGEEAAFRELRDRWQPDTVSLFELVETRRTEAGSAQNGVQDAAEGMQRELEREEDELEGEDEDEFYEALKAVIKDWDSLHRDYYDLIVHLSVLNVPDIVTRLGGLGERLSEIADALGELPVTEGTETAAGSLIEAAQTELSALRHLIDLLVSVDVADAPASGDEEPDPGDSRPPPETEPEIGTLFSEMNAQVREVEEEVNDARRLTPPDTEAEREQNLADLEAFLERYQALVAEWDSFHERYDQWRRDEGGCDRTVVSQEMAQFNAKVSRLAQKVRDLPHLSHLLPVYEALVEAAEREEGAVRSLVNSWRPFAVDAFKALDTDRVTVDRLRRQADIGLKELEGRQGISSGGP